MLVRKSATGFLIAIQTNMTLPYNVMLLVNPWYLGILIFFHSASWSSDKNAQWPWKNISSFECTVMIAIFQACFSKEFFYSSSLSTKGLGSLDLLSLMVNKFLGEYTLSQRHCMEIHICQANNSRLAKF